jgi:hypothetical protein
MRPGPNCVVSNSSSFSRSIVPISIGEANGQTRSGQSSADRHAAGNVSLVVLANNQHHNCHAKRPAKPKYIAEQMAITQCATDDDGHADHHHRTGGESGSRFSSA